MTPEPEPEPTGPRISVKLLAADIGGQSALLSDVYYQIVDNTTSTTVAEVVGGSMIGYHTFSVTAGHQYRINLIANNGTKFTFLTTDPSMFSLGDSEKYRVINSMPDDEYVLDIKKMNLGA